MKKLLRWLFVTIVGTVDLWAASSIPVEGVASWYGQEHAGKTMANGKPFDPTKLTCASWYYPFGTRLLVRTGEGRSVIVEVTDRGPAKDGSISPRIIDLSKAAFERLGRPGIGLINVTVSLAP